MANKSIKNGYRFFYNIDFDVSAILKLWYYEKGIKAKEKIEILSKGISIRYKGYTFHFVKSKFFILQKGKYKVIFTDLFNFYKSSLQKASELYLKDISKDDIDGNRLNNDLEYWNSNLDAIINYCIKDCKITERLADILITSITKSKIALPKMMVSSGSLAKADFRTYCYIPRLSNIPFQILQIAYNCYYGGKFEIIKRGFFEKAYCYDVNSEYPRIIKDLPNLTEGLWFKTLKIPKKPTIAYYKVDLNIPPSISISTIQYKLPSGVIISVCGIIRNKWLTWYDIDLMRNYITKIHDGFEFRLKYTPKEIKEKQIEHIIYPFRKRIKLHYAKKTKYKDNNDSLYMIHKLTMNAFYGANIERKEVYDKKGNKIYKVGKLFNPIYASQITAFGRWKVLKHIPFSEWSNILAIHTDSIISEKDFSHYLKINNKIGNWSCEAIGKAVILATGIYQIDKKCKTRGFPIKLINRNWFEFLDNNGIESKIQFEFGHMYKLSESLKGSKFDKLNTMDIITRDLKPNIDYKRTWHDDFKNFKDVLNRSIESGLYYVNMTENDSNITLDMLYENPLIVNKSS